MGNQSMQKALFSYFILSILILVRPSVALSESDTSYESNQRKEKVRELCERNPNHPKCEKFLDSTYRRYSDLEKESRENSNLEEKRLEQLNQREIQQELLSFCKQDPDAPRCAKLKSRPGLKHSLSTVQR